MNEKERSISHSYARNLTKRKGQTLKFHREIIKSDGKENSETVTFSVDKMSRFVYNNNKVKK